MHNCFYPVARVTLATGILALGDLTLTINRHLARIWDGLIFFRLGLMFTNQALVTNRTTQPALSLHSESV